MKPFTTITLFAIAPSLLVTAHDETILMEAGDTLQQGKSLFSDNGNCELRLQLDGNLVTRRKVDGVFKAAWSSGAHKRASPNYIARLQKDGNLVVSDKGTPVWSTNSNRIGRFRPGFKLLFDNERCRLRIRENPEFPCSVEGWKCTRPFWCQQPGEESSWCNPVHFVYEIDDSDYHDVWWENIHDAQLFKDGLLIQKKEMITTLYDYDYDGQFTLHLQEDCNLVSFKGIDLAERGSIGWTSKTIYPPETDCYFYADYSRIALFPGIFDKSLPTFSENRGKPLWEMQITDSPVGYWLEFLGYWWED